MFKKPRLLLYILALFLPWQVGIYAASILGITFTPMLVLGLLLFLLLTLKALLTLHFPRIPLLALWLAFIGFSAIAYTQSPAITGFIQGLWVIFRMSTVMALVYIGFWCFVRSREQVKTLLLLLAISAGAAGVVGITQTLSNGQLLSGMMTNGRFLGILYPLPPEVLQENTDVLRAHLFSNGIFRAHGLFYRSNGFGSFISTTSLLTWGLWRSHIQGKKRWLILLTFLAQTAGVVVSLSRSAWIAFLVGMIIAIGIEMLIVNPHLSSLRNILLIATVSAISILGIIALIATPAIAERLETLQNPLEVSDVVWRINIWEIAIEKIAQNPLGYGHSTVVEEVTSQGTASYGAHNFLLGLAYERGIPALVIIGLFLALTLLSIFRWLKTKQPYTEKMIVAGVFASIITLLVNGIGGALVDIENIAMLIWLLICIGIFWSRKSPKNMNSQQIAIKRSDLNEENAL